MAKEFKFIALSDAGVHFKQDSDVGMLLGYAAVTGNLDEGGDIILPGAFKDTIDEFLQSGFTAHSHDWSVDGVIGYPVKAYEDETGLYVESQFHSTPDAQAVRTKAQERMAAGKEVGLSIGYGIAAQRKYLFPKEYEAELPKYVKAEYLADALGKAPRFAKIRLLSKLDNFEHSIVTAQMNKLAMASGVKAASGFDVKGIFEDVLSERTNTLYNLCTILGSALGQLRWAAQTAVDAGATLDVEAALAEILTEFGARVTEAFLASVQSGEYWGTYFGYYYDGRSSAESKTLSGKQGAAPVLTLAERSNLAASACEGLAQHGADLSLALKALVEDGMSKLEARTKEGRMLSQATIDQMQSVCDSIDPMSEGMTAIKTSLLGLIEKATPKKEAIPDTGALAVDFLRANMHRIGANHVGN